MTAPYIGITGIVTPGDVATIASCVALAPASHRLMAGVLVSAKTLRGERVTSRRYPHASRVEALLAGCAEAGAWPVVHYNTRAEGEVFGLELALLCSLFPSLRGVQLNVATPDHRVVADFVRSHPGVEVIVQINRAALCATPRPVDAIHYANAYDSAHHALLDLSGGTGAPVDGSLAARIARAWGAFNVGPRLGVAGSLGPGAGESLAALRDDAGAEAFAALSFDTETGVRSPVADPTPGEKHQDALDADKARAWVALAARAIRGEASL